MTAKQPTASGISRLLAKSGFKRATYENGCLDRAGFAVTEAGSGAGVRVEHDTTLPDHRQPILGHESQTERAYGRVEALDALLATMDRMEADR